MSPRINPVFLLAKLAVAIVPTVALAAEWSAIPSGGESMFPSDSLSALRVPSGTLARSEMIDVADMPFSRALRVTVLGVTKQPWDLQILGTTLGDVQSGDAVLLSAFVRGQSAGSETGEGTATAFLQRSSGDFAKVMTMPMAAGREWKQFLLPVKVDTTLGPGQHNLTVFLGYGPQTIEIGGVSLVNYRDRRKIAELPRTKITWAGSEQDAPWRAEAALRIEQIRKANLRVSLVDAAGNPVPGANVHVVQTRHEFGFGSAVAADGLNERGEDGDRYREVVRTWFNKAVLENDLKWPNWESNRTRASGALSWLRENGITMVRGHNLVWPSWKYMPSDVQQLQASRDALRTRVISHIDEEADAVRGQITEWDVLNEPYTNTDLQTVLGDAEMAEWFRHARAHDALPVLYINDFGILSGGGLDQPHQDGYYQTIRGLVEAGAPIGGIGMQGHFGSQLTPVSKIWQTLDRFATFGKEIQITEFDIDTDDEEVQGAYTRDFMTAVFSHASVSGFMMWGFWEGRHWKPKAAMFRRDWSMKLNASAFHDLVYRDWWTDVSGQTASDGSFAVRAFKGQHIVNVCISGQTVSVPVTLGLDGAAITITVPK